MESILRNIIPSTEAHPVKGEGGMALAMIMLEKSLETGKNANYTTFSTVRQF